MNVIFGGANVYIPVYRALIRTSLYSVTGHEVIFAAHERSLVNHVYNPEEFGATHELALTLEELMRARIPRTEVLVVAREQLKEMEAVKPLSGEARVGAIASTIEGRVLPEHLIVRYYGSRENYIKALRGRLAEDTNDLRFASETAPELWRQSRQFSIDQTTADLIANGFVP